MNIVVSDFDEATWLANGLEWARYLKTRSMQGAAIDCGIPEHGLGKLSDYGITVLKSKPSKIDCWKAMVSGLDGGVWAYVKSEDVKKIDLPDLFAQASKSMVAAVKPVDSLFDIVFSIDSLENKTATATLITEKLVKPNGGIFDIGIIAGNYTKWEIFVGLSTYVKEIDLTISYPSESSLLFNLFASVYDGYVSPYHRKENASC